MNLNTTKKVPTAKLLAHISTIFTPAKQRGFYVGECGDFGGVADGVAIALDDFTVNLYHDKHCEFGEGGWTVDDYNNEETTTEITNRENLADALDVFVKAVAIRLSQQVLRSLGADRVGVTVVVGGGFYNITSPKTGTHQLAVAGTNEERLRAHIAGFIENQKGEQV